MPNDSQKLRIWKLEGRIKDFRIEPHYSSSTSSSTSTSGTAGSITSSSGSTNSTSHSHSTTTTTLTGSTIYFELQIESSNPPLNGQPKANVMMSLSEMAPQLDGEKVHIDACRFLKTGQFCAKSLSCPDQGLSVETSDARISKGTPPIEPQSLPYMITIMAVIFVGLAVGSWFEWMPTLPLLAFGAAGLIVIISTLIAYSTKKSSYLAEKEFYSNLESAAAFESA